MKKFKLAVLTVLCLGAINASAKVDTISSTTINGEWNDNNVIEKICIDGYVYINIYQKKPVMTIQYGRQTSLTSYAVLASTTQSFINANFISKAETCKNKTEKQVAKK